VSEVEFLELRKAQRYGRDPRNGHSTIYCISKAGTRACSSRPCVVGAEPAVRRCGRGAGHAAPGRPPRPTSPLRRRSPRRSRHPRRASACFRRSVPHRPWTWLRAALHRPDDGAVARPAAGCAAAVDSLAPDVAAASEGVLLRCSAFLHQRAAASGAAFYHLDVFAGNFCRVGLGGAAPVRARGPGARLH